MHSYIHSVHRPTKYSQPVIIIGIYSHTHPLTCSSLPPTMQLPGHSLVAGVYTGVHEQVTTTDHTFIRKHSPTPSRLLTLLMAINTCKERKKNHQKTLIGRFVLAYRQLGFESRDYGSQYQPNTNEVFTSFCINLRCCGHACSGHHFSSEPGYDHLILLTHQSLH